MSAVYIYCAFATEQYHTFVFDPLGTNEWQFAVSSDVLYMPSCCSLRTKFSPMFMPDCFLTHRYSNVDEYYHWTDCIWKCRSFLSNTVNTTSQKKICMYCTHLPESKILLSTMVWNLIYNSGKCLNIRTLAGCFFKCTCVVCRSFCGDVFLYWMFGPMGGFKLQHIFPV